MLSHSLASSFQVAMNEKAAELRRFLIAIPPGARIIATQLFLVGDSYVMTVIT